MIAASGVPTSAACRLYAERAAPVLGYLATYSDPLVNITQLEIKAIHRLLHLPTNAITLNTIAHWEEKGGPRIVNIAGMCAATAMRVAWTHRGMLQQLRRDMDDVAEAAAPANRYFEGVWSKDWDAPDRALPLEQT